MPRCLRHCRQSVRTRLPDKRLEQTLVTRQMDEALRMPLDAEHRRHARSLYSFDYPVSRPCAHTETRCDGIDGVMVRAVHAK